MKKAKQQCGLKTNSDCDGEFNAIVVQDRYESVVGNCGVAVKNEHGKKWMEWCQQNDLVVLNTWLKQHPRRLWTWKSPDVKESD